MSTSFQEILLSPPGLVVLSSSKKHLLAFAIMSDKYCFRDLASTAPPHPFVSSRSSSAASLSLCVIGNAEFEADKQFLYQQLDSLSLPADNAEDETKSSHDLPESVATSSSSPKSQSSPRVKSPKPRADSSEDLQSGRAASPRKKKQNSESKRKSRNPKEPDLLEAGE